jgi:hypothetical protein
MGNIDIYPSAAGGRAVSRQVGRALNRVEGGASIDIARVEARADIQAAQVDAMTAVTQRGLQGVAFISQVEQQLAQVVPLAASRLQAIADIGALGLSQVVMDTANKLRRI